MDTASSVLSDESRILAGILLLSLVPVRREDLYLLKIVRGAAHVTPFQEKFARAGHAHAAVLSCSRSSARSSRTRRARPA